MKRFILIAALLAPTPGFCLGLCWPSCRQVLPLDTRSVQITENGTGFFAIGLGEDLMADAARETLRAGYTHFRLSRANQYQQFSGGGFNAYRSGNFINGVSTPTRHGTASAVVHMCNAGEPDCANTFDARAILNREGE
jgi:hypothetical protein